MMERESGWDIDVHTCICTCSVGYRKTYWHRYTCSVFTYSLKFYCCQKGEYCYHYWLHILICLYCRSLCKKYTELYAQKLSSSSPPASVVAKLLVSAGYYYNLSASGGWLFICLMSPIFFFNFYLLLFYFLPSFVFVAVISLFLLLLLYWQDIEDKLDVFNITVCRQQAETLVSQLLMHLHMHSAVSVYYLTLSLIMYL